MNIPSYFNLQTANIPLKQNTAKSVFKESFSSIFSGKQQDSSAINHPALKVKETFSCVDSFGRTIHMEYDESSTEDDPVIYAEGIGDNGNPYKTKIHINDVNSYHATYLEMTALAFHTGTMNELTTSLPASKFYSFFQKENYIESFTNFKQLNENIYAQLETERLNAYLDFFNPHKKD